MSNKENKTTNNETLKQTEDMQTEDMQTENKDSLVKNLQEVRELVNELVSNNPEAQIEKWCKYDESNNMQEEVGKNLPKFFEQLSKEDQEIVKKATDDMNKIFGKKEQAEVQNNKGSKSKGGKRQKDSEKRNTDKSINKALEILLYDPKYEGAFAYDTFTEQRQIIREVDWHTNWQIQIEKYPVTFTNEDAAEICRDLQLRFDITSDRTIEKAITLVFAAKKYNSLLEKIKKGVWDGIPRIDTYLQKHLGVEDDKDGVATQTARNIYLTALLRLQGKTVKNDIIPILTGEQGIGKSTAIKNMAFSDEYYTYNFELKDKAVENGLQIRGKQIVELAELSGIKLKDLERFKAFASTIEDQYRDIYGKQYESHIRTAMLIGSTNRETFIPDEAGIRRFTALECHADKIEEVLIPSADGIEEKKQIYYRQQEERKQRWYEAFARLLNGERPVLNKLYEQNAAKLQEKHIIRDEWTTIVFDYIRRQVVDNNIKDQGKLYAINVYKDCIPTNGNVVNYDTNTSRRMSKLLSTFSFLTKYKTKGITAFKFDRSKYDEYLGTVNEQENN